MTVSVKNTAPFSPAKPTSDLAQVDAHVIQPHEYDELPDLADFDAADGVTEVAGIPVRGRPSLGDKAKRAVSIRLDAATIEAFKATGPGWQTRMNTSLKISPTMWRMVVEYDEFVLDMQQLLDQLRSGGAGIVTEPLATSVSKVERNIKNVSETVRGLRQQLLDGDCPG